jgi:hypothetical protein
MQVVFDKLFTTMELVEIFYCQTFGFSIGSIPIAPCGCLGQTGFAP